MNVDLINKLRDGVPSKIERWPGNDGEDIVLDIAVAGKLMTQAADALEAALSTNVDTKADANEILLALKNLLDAYSKPDERLCCDGRDCGCMGSTVHQQAEHYARAAIAKAEGHS